MGTIGIREGSAGSPLRGATRERAILDAVAELLIEVGYERLTMDVIATRARASKATIYRRWPGKAELVSELLKRHAERDVATIPDTGSLRGDLLAAVDSISAAITGDAGPSLLGLIEAIRADVSLREQVRAQIGRSSRKVGDVLLDRARARGQELRPVQGQLVLDLAVAQLLMRALFRGNQSEAAFRRELVDEILLPLLTGTFPSVTSPSPHPTTSCGVATNYQGDRYMPQNAQISESGAEIIDASHASSEVVQLVTATFAAKSSRDVDRTMGFFSPAQLVYTDTTIGETYRNWSEQRGAFDRFMTTMWGEGTRSYPTRVVGDHHSAIVVFVDSPEMFGREVRIMAAIDFDDDGKITRQVDYWDGRQFGVAALEQHRYPADQIPDEFGELATGEHAHPQLQQAALSFHRALADGNAAAAAELLTADAVFEDLTLRTTIVGAIAIGGYLDRAIASLPYGSGSKLRHTVGSKQGGGYEWTGFGPVKNGVTALELDLQDRISRVTAMWDASRIDTATITALIGQTVEQ